MLLNVNAIPDDASLVDIVEAFVAQGHEGTFWDFKKVWPQCNNDIVHDIACMANNLESATGYIIVGIDEENNYATVDVRENQEFRKNTQQLNNLLWSYPWAYASPSVEVIEVDFVDGYIDVIVVYRKNESVPYFLTREVDRQGKKLRAGAIYTRIKDSNTPIDETASLQDTEMLWKRRFGLDLTPVERLPMLISQHDMWQETSPHPAYDTEAFIEAFYHKAFPEFTFMMVPDGHRDGWEYYMLACPFNKEADWYITRFYYHNTLLHESLGVYIDHHFFPVPECAVIPGVDATRKLYYYYVDGSLNDNLEQFCLARETPGEDACHRLIMKLIPRYRSKREKAEFESYIRDNSGALMREKASIQICLYGPDKKPDGYRDDYLELFRDEAEYGAALVVLLDKFRSGIIRRNRF